MFSTNLPQTKLGRVIICTRFDLRPFCPNLADKGGVYRRFSKGGCEQTSKKCQPKRRKYRYSGFFLCLFAELKANRKRTRNNVRHELLNFSRRGKNGVTWK